MLQDGLWKLKFTINMLNHFKDWDNTRKYIQTPWHSNIAKIGHLEFIMSKFSNNISGKPIIGVEPIGILEGIYSKNTFIYKGTQDGIYQLPNASTYSTNGIFVINKSDYTLKVQGNIYDFGTVSEKDILTGEIIFFISDGEDWTKF